MRFVLVQRTPLVTRQEIACMLAALAPDHAPTTDYQRGYIDALSRVAAAYGIEVVRDEKGLAVEVVS
jgi:hypothetical protein